MTAFFCILYLKQMSGGELRHLVEKLEILSAGNSVKFEGCAERRTHKELLK